MMRGGPSHLQLPSDAEEVSIARIQLNELDYGEHVPVQFVQLHNLFLESLRIKRVQSPHSNAYEAGQTISESVNDVTRLLNAPFKRHYTN